MADNESSVERKQLGLFALLRSDWIANKGNLKGRLVVAAYRFAHWFRCTHCLTCWLGLPYLACYRLLVEWLMGIEIPPLTKIGQGFILNHGQGLVINNGCVIGRDCRLRHGVTLGNRGDIPGCPVLGDGVEIGAGAIVIGPITIGEGAVVGAGSVVTKDVEPGQVVVGNPARVLSKRTEAAE
jgi:serine acetyltransferase